MNRYHVRKDGVPKVGYKKSLAMAQLEKYPNMVVYKCPKCHWYHLGNHSYRIEQSRKKRLDSIMVGKLIGALRGVLDKEREYEIQNSHGRRSM